MFNINQMLLHFQQFNLIFVAISYVMFCSSLLFTFECKIIVVVIFALDWLRSDRNVSEFEKTEYCFINKYWLILFARS